MKIDNHFVVSISGKTWLLILSCLSTGASGMTHGCLNRSAKGSKCLSFESNCYTEFSPLYIRTIFLRIIIHTYLTKWGGSNSSLSLVYEVRILSSKERSPIIENQCHKYIVLATCFYLSFPAYSHTCILNHKKFNKVKQYISCCTFKYW